MIDSHFVPRFAYASTWRDGKPVIAHLEVIKVYDYGSVDCKFVGGRGEWRVTRKDLFRSWHEAKEALRQKQYEVIQTYLSDVQRAVDELRLIETMKPETCE